MAASAASAAALCATATARATAAVYLEGPIPRFKGQNGSTRRRNGPPTPPEPTAVNAGFRPRSVRTPQPPGRHDCGSSYGAVRQRTRRGANPRWRVRGSLTSRRSAARTPRQREPAEPVVDLPLHPGDGVGTVVGRVEQAPSRCINAAALSVRIARANSYVHSRVWVLPVAICRLSGDPAVGKSRVMFDLTAHEWRAARCARRTKDGSGWPIDVGPVGPPRASEGLGQSAQPVAIASLASARQYQTTADRSPPPTGRRRRASRLTLTSCQQRPVIVSGKARFVPPCPG